MEAADVATLSVGVAILAFLWSLHRDIANLRECMARIEGLFEGFFRLTSVNPALLFGWRDWRDGRSGSPSGSSCATPRCRHLSPR